MKTWYMRSGANAFSSFYSLHSDNRLVTIHLDVSLTSSYSWYAPCFVFFDKEKLRDVKKFAWEVKSDELHLSYGDQDLKSELRSDGYAYLIQQDGDEFELGAIEGKIDSFGHRPAGVSHADLERLAEFCLTKKEGDEYTLTGKGASEAQLAAAIQVELAKYDELHRQGEA